MNKKIDKKILKQKAILLEESFKKYSGNNTDIYEVKSSICGLIKKSKNELLEYPIDIDDVPGRYQWVNSGISWPDDIRNSYYEFRVEISGGLSDAAKAFLLKRGNKV